MKMKQHNNMKSKTPKKQMKITQIMQLIQPATPLAMLGLLERMSPTKKQ
jgi:hypothetical protein